MNTLFQGNFHFEHELAIGRSFQPSQALQRINAELAVLWVVLAENNDSLSLPQSVEAGFLEGLAEQGLAAVQPVYDVIPPRDTIQLCPWGWTDRLRDWAGSRKIPFDAPMQTVVREVNSRQFSVQCETEWELGLEGQAMINTVEELSEAIGKLPGDTAYWCVKAEFGMSARERILGHGSMPTQRDVDWVNRRLRADGRVFFEPWVERIDEAGLQFTIPTTGELILEGVTSLLTDESGAYRGSRFTSDSAAEQSWLDAVDVCMRLAKDVQQRGYFGPLGIDAMRYRSHDGQVRVRPLMDVNARYTMGRLSMGLQKLLERGELGSWLHVRWNSDDRLSPHQYFEEICGALPDSVRVLRTSPFEVDGQPTSHGTLAVITNSSTSLREAESIVLGS